MYYCTVQYSKLPEAVLKYFFSVINVPGLEGVDLDLKTPKQHWQGTSDALRSTALPRWIPCQVPEV